jgi:hypothetical protein
MTPFVTTNGPMEDLSLEDDVGDRVEGVVGGEVGKVGRETRWSEVGIPADSIAWKEEVALKPLPRTAATHTVSGSSYRNSSPGRGLPRFKCQSVSHLHFPLDYQPDVLFASMSNPQRNRKWVLPADLKC